MNDRREKLENLLMDSMHLLDSSQSTLLKSLDKCRHIGLKKAYSFEEFESFDSLTSKFARTADIFTQRVLTTLFKILREEAVTFVDKAHLAEKLSLVPSADELLAIRDLRNQIAHEYKTEEIEALFEDVFEMTDRLSCCLDMTRAFIRTKSLL